MYCFLRSVVSMLVNSVCEILKGSFTMFDLLFSDTCNFLK